MTDQKPVCRVLADIVANSGKRVSVVGEYVQVDARQRPTPPPHYDGHAAVRMADGNLVLLEPGWSPAAIRSADERKQWPGHPVEAVGIVWLKSPEPPEPVAFLSGPCLAPVESVSNLTG